MPSISMRSIASFNKTLTDFDRLALGAWLAMALVCGAVALGALPWSLLNRGNFCLFKLWWGVSCPGCGMAHSLIYGFQGQWAQSFQYHPLGLPLLLTWTFWIIYGAGNAYKGRAFSQGFPLAVRGALYRSVALGVVLGVFILRLAGVC